VSRHGAKRPPSKAELRRELERATRRFISDGGEVEEVPAGTSVYAPGTRPPPTQPLFTQPRETRTPLNDVAAALDARRAARKRRRVVRSRKPEPRRQVIYDDFGEPLRTGVVRRLTRMARRPRAQVASTKRHGEMISLRETITVERPLGECFDYVADFRSAAEWDATAFRARKTSDGPVGVDSAFDVWCSLPLGSIKIEYRIVEFEPGSLDHPAGRKLAVRCSGLDQLQRHRRRAPRSSTARISASACPSLQWKAHSRPACSAWARSPWAD
jgi:hypothetical protein